LYWRRRTDKNSKAIAAIVGYFKGGVGFLPGVCPLWVGQSRRIPGPADGAAMGKLAIRKKPDFDFRRCGRVRGFENLSALLPNPPPPRIGGPPHAYHRCPRQNIRPPRETETTVLGGGTIRHARHGDLLSIWGAASTMPCDANRMATAGEVGRRPAGKTGAPSGAAGIAARSVAGWMGRRARRERLSPGLGGRDWGASHGINPSEAVRHGDRHRSHARPADWAFPRPMVSTLASGNTAPLPGNGERHRSSLNRDCRLVGWGWKTEFPARFLKKCRRRDLRDWSRRAEQRTPAVRPGGGQGRSVVAMHCLAPTPRIAFQRGEAIVGG